MQRARTGMKTTTVVQAKLHLSMRCTKIPEDDVASLVFGQHQHKRFPAQQPRNALCVAVSSHTCSDYGSSIQLSCMACCGNHETWWKRNTPNNKYVHCERKNADQALAAWISDTTRLIKDRIGKIGCQSGWKMVAHSMSGWLGHCARRGRATQYGITAVTWKRTKENLTYDRWFCTMPKHKLAPWDSILYLNFDEHSKWSVMTLHKTGWRERKRGHLYCQFFHRESMVLQLENTQDWKDKCEPLFCEFPLENYGASQADLWENNTDSPRSAVTPFFRTCVPRHTFFFCFQFGDLDGV